MRTSRRAHRLGVACLLLGALGIACGRAPSSDVSDSTFVATMAELRRVQSGVAADSAARAKERERVLQRRGLTAARLERAARALAADPERASKVFQAIARKTSESGSAEPSTAPPAVTPPGAPPRGAPPRGAPAGKLRRARATRAGIR